MTVQLTSKKTETLNNMTEVLHASSQYVGSEVGCFWSGGCEVVVKVTASGWRRGVHTGVKSEEVTGEVFHKHESNYSKKYATHLYMLLFFIDSLNNNIAQL